MAYGRLCTEFYDIDKPQPPADALSFIRDLAQRSGGPILEPMCGSGRFLLPLLAEGFDIEGTDTSEAMLDACRRHAAERGLTPMLRNQSIDALEVRRHFGLVIIPAGSFCLLIDPALIRRSLERLRGAMADGATLLVEIERRSDRLSTTSGVWGGRWVTRPDGSKIIISWLGTYDGQTRIMSSIHRYDLVRDGVLVESEFEDFALRFYDTEEFTALLASVGFRGIRTFRAYGDGPPGGADGSVVVTCTT